MPRRRRIPFLTDNNVPDSVGTYLTARGHSVVRMRDIMAVDSPDLIVALAAMNAGRVLVSWDKDFNAQRFQQERFARLVRLAFSCPEPDAVARLGEEVDALELEWSKALKRENPRFVFSIGPDQMRIRRR